MSEVIFIETKNEQETIYLGKKTGKMLRGNEIILLQGELGSGKTRFVQGIAAGLGVEDEVTSPTYNLINEYRGNIPLFHMDLYRLDNEMDLYNIGFEDYLYRDGVVVIEWPELAYDLLENRFLLFEFKVNENNNRQIRVKGKGKNTDKILKGLSEYVDIRN